MDFITTMMPATTTKNDNEDIILILIMIVGVCFIMLGIGWCIVKYDNIERKCEMVHVSIILIIIGIGLMTYGGININKKKDE